jgi:hypothetical protein
VQTSTASAYNRRGIDGDLVAKDSDGLKCGFTISRAWEYQKSDASLSVRGPRTMRTGPTTWRDSTMINFKLLSVAAILSMAIVTPVLAQQAVQEPGLQAFYESLGVGSQSSATASAMASARGGSYARTPVKHISAKHVTAR